MKREADMDEKWNHGEGSAERKLSLKPYQKPQFRFERVFETRALTCGKIQSTQSACAHNRKNS